MVERGANNAKVVGSIPTLAILFLFCFCFVVLFLFHLFVVPERGVLGCILCVIALGEEDQHVCVGAVLVGNVLKIV